jgi:Core-2/I-Branching enzyme
MKIALCFIINYEHILNKEEIWREWIEPNKDIINIYFYYKDFKKIKSKWIMEHTIPPSYIHETSYYHVIPAYISILQFAMQHDTQNKWFCMLTDSCCPIISPKKFRYLFYENHNSSLFSWKPAWWNPHFHQRGNLAKLPKELWLANDPWFILTIENIRQIIHFINNQQTITQTICSGGLANETLFAVIFKLYKELDDPTKKSHIHCVSTHIADWNRRSSPTSPHLFKDADETDIKFIESELERNKYSIFIRKIAPEFPDDILRHYIFEYNKEQTDKLVLIEPREMIYNKYGHILKKSIYILSFVIIAYIFNLFFL